jgi:hypothetical protein
MLTRPKMELLCAAINRSGLMGRVRRGPIEDPGRPRNRTGGGDRRELALPRSGCPLVGAAARDDGRPPPPASSSLSHSRVLRPQQAGRRSPGRGATSPPRNTTRKLCRTFSTLTSEVFRRLRHDPTECDSDEFREYSVAYENKRFSSPRNVSNSNRLHERRFVARTCSLDRRSSRAPSSGAQCGRGSLFHSRVLGGPEGCAGCSLSSIVPQGPLPGDRSYPC